MIIVADSSPLNYLALIESIDLLRQLYDKAIRIEPTGTCATNAWTP